MSRLNGLLTIFKREVAEDSKITFIGNLGLCSPFSEFLSFGVNDKETHFIPLLDVDNCHEFVLKSYGMAIDENVSDPNDSDVVVLLGELAVPNFNVDVNNLVELVDNIKKDDGGIENRLYEKINTIYENGKPIKADSEV